MIDFEDTEFVDQEDENHASVTIPEIWYDKSLKLESIFSSDIRTASNGSCANDTIV